MNEVVRFKPLEKPSCYLWWLIPKSLWRRAVQYEDPLVYSHGNQSLFMPRGVVVNGSSWPYFVGWLFNPLGAGFIGGSFHDFCYEYGFFLVITNDDRVKVMPCTRDEADSLWKALYICDNEPVEFNLFGKTYKFFRGVEISAWIGRIVLKLFGRFAWKNLTANRAKKRKLMVDQLFKEYDVCF